MPALPPEEIVQAIEEAFTDSAASAVLVSQPRTNPRRFYVVAGEVSFSAWIYLWTLTHGGGPARPVDDGADATVYHLLSRVGRLESVTEDEINKLPVDRRRIVKKLSHLVRDSHFRRKVTVAYDRKCCVTGLQLRLIDAAHILPVGAEGSTEDVQNGLCLSPTYHRAYDRKLIYLTEERRMLINDREKARLIKLGLGGGLQEFESHLGKEIFLPPDRNQWPRVEFIRSANKFREI